MTPIAGTPFLHKSGAGDRRHRLCTLIEVHGYPKYDLPCFTVRFENGEDLLALGSELHDPETGDWAWTADSWPAFMRDGGWQWHAPTGEWVRDFETESTPGGEK